MTTPKCRHSLFIRRIYWQYVMTIVFSIGLVAMMLAVYKYVAAHIRSVRESRVPQSAKNFFYLSFTYYVVLMLYFIVLIINLQYFCRNELVQSYIASGTFYCYFFQTLLLTFVFLIRLVQIFDSTEYAVAKRTVRLSVGVMLTDWCMGTVAYSLVTFSDHPQAIWTSLWALAGLVSICITIALTAAFIYRLNMVHKSCQGAATKGHRLLTVITKAAILCSVSTCITFVCMATFLIRNSVQSVHLQFASELIVFFDLSTNFLCVLLAGKNFNAWYFWICGCCHKRVFLCCGGDAKNLEMELASTETEKQHSRQSGTDELSR